MKYLKEIDWKVIGINFAFIFAYFLVIPLIVLFSFSLFQMKINTPFLSILASLISYLASLIFFVIVYWHSLKKDWKIFTSDWKRHFKESFFCWIKALIFMMVSNYVIILINSNIAINETANRTIINNYPLFSIFIMIFLGPFLEEILFRKGFRKAFKNKIAFCLFTGFVFGFVHIMASMNFDSWSLFLESIVLNWKQLLFIIPYGGMGYFFADAYWESDTIFTTVCTHMMHNTLAVLLSFVGV